MAGDNEDLDAPYSVIDGDPTEVRNTEYGALPPIHASRYRFTFCDSCDCIHVGVADADGRTYTEILFDEEDLTRMLYSLLQHKQGRSKCPAPN